MKSNEHRARILKDIACRAPDYTPRWRFSPENPDAGTALAMIWADMHSQTLERFERLPDNFRRALFDALGSKPRAAVKAGGYLAFTVRGGADCLIIPKGTEVSAPESPDAALVTVDDFNAGPARVFEIYRILPERDIAERLEGLSDIALSGSQRGGEHIWTFTHSFAFDVSSAAGLRITPELESGKLYVLSEAQWEFRDGGQWRALSVCKDGTSLLCGFPKDKKHSDALRVTVTDDAVLSAFTAKPSGSGLFPDALYQDSTQEQDGFYPFGQRFIPGVCAYFGCFDALSKPGARVELSFTLKYDDFELEGYAGTQVYLKKLMRASEITPPEEYLITAGEVKWEYYNGVGWAALETQSGEALFGGNIDGRVTITFECPQDIKSAVVGAHELPFIRVRLLAAENLYRRPGRYRTPHISDIRFSYRYITGVPVTGIAVTEHLETKEKTLPSRLAAPPIGPAALYFAQSAAFSSGTILFHLKPGGGPFGTRWEYLTAGGWRELNVRDDTEGLRKTGILSYMTAEPPEYAQLWGRRAYWMRLIQDRPEEKRSAGWPFLYALFENAVYAEAKKPGKSSALPAGAFTTLSSPFAGVESVINPIAAYGGAEEEEEQGIMARCSAGLSNRGRAVSREDCEELALAASPRVLRAKLYPHTDENGNYAYGTSCLVILAQDADEFGFEKLRREIMEYIAARRALGTGELVIVPPRYIAVNVTASVLIKNHIEGLEVKGKIADKLGGMLLPVKWVIGSLPAPGQICAALRAAEGVTGLVSAETSYTLISGINTSYERALREVFALPVCGGAEITCICGEMR